ncbi:single-stranded DNA-binding protein [Mycobacterium sp. AMU20-3851]|jgi:single-strand DNA-binding protein|uniref:single-stranded DNA-binding protein n=1 Tax=Mycobacterium sp. AMU20-3851 TaxID=3122055 RepID=UPI003754C8C5
MFETPFSIVGTVVTDPVLRRINDQEFVRFRVVSNSRRRTPEGTWETGSSLFLTVNCWGKVADGVAGVLFKGDPVIVVGQIYTSEYDDKEGNHRSTVEVRATSVGPDLNRVRAKLDRAQRVPDPIESDGGQDTEPDQEATPDSELPISA